MAMYQSKETGEVLTYAQMIQQFREDYDGEDPTNPETWDEYYDRIEDTLYDLIVRKAEELDWKVTFESQKRAGTGEEERYAEFSQYSPAGEDFSFCVFFNEIEEIPHEVAVYSMEFDPDDHIEMWVEARKNGVSGVPSIRELVKDADDINDMIEKLSDALRDVMNEWRKKHKEENK